MILNRVCPTLCSIIALVSPALSVDDTITDIMHGQNLLVQQMQLGLLQSSDKKNHAWMFGQLLE